MATRVNKPFVIGLIAVLAAVVLGMVGFYHLFVQRDAAELGRRAEALMEAGEPRQALHYLGPALRQDRTNLALIDLYLEALEHAVVDDTLTAQSHVGQLRQWKQRAAELRPDDPHRIEAFYAFELRLAEELGDPEAYDRLHTLAANRLAAQPRDPVALKYQGIAKVHRLTADTPSRQRREALEALEAAGAHFAEDPEVLHYQARWHLFEADLARRANERERAAELQAEARARSLTALEADPTDIDRRLRHLHVLVRLDDEEARHDAHELLDALLEQLAEAPAPPTGAVVSVTDLLPRLDRERVDASGTDTGRPMTRGVQRARELLETVVESHDADSDAALLAALGRMRALTGDRDAAIEAYEAMRRKSERGPALEYLRDRAVRTRGSVELADLLLARADGDDDADRREQTLERVASLIERIEQSAGEVDELAKLRGKLAMLRGQVSEAAMHLDRAVERMDAPPPSVLVLSSKAHRQLGNWGTAAARLERLLEMHGELAPIRLDLAELLLDGGRLADAERHIQALIADHPRYAEPRQLHVRLLAERGRLDEAVAQYRMLPDQAQSVLLRPLSEAHVAAGREDEAVALLERRLAEDPTDLRAVHLMAQLAPEASRTRDALARARDGGAAEPAIRLIERQLERSGSHDATGDWLSTLLEDQDEPALPQVLLKVQLAQRRGDDAALRAAIDEAAAIDPEHPHVIGLRFELALHDGDWSLAERLATQAQRRDLDQAQGAFFFGRLAAARDELAEATVHYRRGLGMRRVYAEGWRRFGDVLLRRDDLTAAIDAYRRAIDQQPDNVAAHRGLAVALDQRDEHDGALEHLREAVRHAPANEALFEHYARYEQRFGDPARVGTLRRRLARTHPHAAANRRALAAEAVGRGDLEAAAMHYEQIVRTHDDRAAAAPGTDLAGDAPLERLGDRLTLASLRLQLNEPERVVALLDDAFAASHAPLLARRARALAMLGRDEEAADGFDRALDTARSPQQVTDVATQRVVVAGVSHVLDWLEPTEAEAAPATATDAEVPALWRAIAAAGIELQINRPRRAIERLEPWLSILEPAEQTAQAERPGRSATGEAAETPEAAEAPGFDAGVRWSFYRLLAQAHQRLGAEPAAAAAAYERMLALRPEHLVTLNDLAYLLTDELEEPERALPLAEQAAELAPENARVLDTLGWTQYHVGEIEAARRTLERAIELEPVPEAHLHLGVVYAALEHAEAAREQFERARELAEWANHRAVLAEARRHLERDLTRTEP